MVPRCLILLVLATLACGSLLDRLEEARSRIRRGSIRLAVSSITVPLHFRRVACFEKDMGCGPLSQLFELTCAVKDLLVGTSLKT